MLKKINGLVKNKKGSEVVQTIMMVIVSLAIGAGVATWIYNIVKRETGKNGEDAVDASNGS